MSLTHPSPPAVSGARRVQRALDAVLVALAAPLCVVAAGWLVRTLDVTSRPVGPMGSCARTSDRSASSRFRESLGTTILTLIVSYALALVIGGGVGFLLGLAPFWRAVFQPIVQGIYSIPKVTLFPLFLVFLGLGLTSRIAFAFVHGFFPMVIVLMSATAALRGSDIYLKLGASLQMRFPQIIRIIILPAVLPSFIMAARLAFGLTFMGTILAEMFSSSGGLGTEIMRSMHSVRIDRILGQVVVIAVLAIIPNALLKWAEVAAQRRMGGDVSGPASRSSRRGAR